MKNNNNKNGSRTMDCNSAQLTALGTDQLNVYKKKKKKLIHPECCTRAEWRSGTAPPLTHALAAVPSLSLTPLALRSRSRGPRSLTGHVIDVSPTAWFKNTISSARKIARASAETRVRDPSGIFGAIRPVSTGGRNTTAVGSRPAVSVATRRRKSVNIVI
uniref:Uncharacterized protein n=1 Tax=Schizaphis graminum TaxID=13262 RepID=A0A2S2N6L2_SCHGA